VQLTKVGDEAVSQSMPPPRHAAEFREIVQLLNAGEELS